ncbi:glutamine amidotransferase-related protein, partial [Candidatus Liberibacter asiaticus]|uniref:glutamine amidotransferase-related protein n=1 Tax=Liberibacter asiaticus TaxID=34021 RepID=UPI00156344EA
SEFPFLGICFGMQMAVIEAARNLAGIPNACSTEFSEAGVPVIALMSEWMKGDQQEKRLPSDDLGATMRLGAYDVSLKEETLISRIYGLDLIPERHRHRYEVNVRYREKLEGCGLKFSGFSVDHALPEVVEYINHPWFIGVQYHPELKSRPLDPHPLFVSFIQATVLYSQSL